MGRLAPLRMSEMSPTQRREIIVDMACARLTFMKGRSSRRDVTVPKEMSDYAHHVLRGDPIYDGLARSRSTANNRVRTQELAAAYKGRIWNEQKAAKRLSGSKENPPLRFQRFAANGITYGVCGYDARTQVSYVMHDLLGIDYWTQGGSRRVARYERQAVDRLMSNRSAARIVTHLVQRLEGAPLRVDHYYGAPCHVKPDDDRRAERDRALKYRLSKRVARLKTEVPAMIRAFSRAMAIWRNNLEPGRKKRKHLVHRKSLEEGMDPEEHAGWRLLVKRHFVRDASMHELYQIDGRFFNGFAKQAAEAHFEQVVTLAQRSS